MWEGGGGGRYSTSFDMGFCLCVFSRYFSSLLLFPHLVIIFRILLALMGPSLFPPFSPSFSFRAHARPCLASLHWHRGLAFSLLSYSPSLSAYVCVCARSWRVYHSCAVGSRLRSLVALMPFPSLSVVSSIVAIRTSLSSLCSLPLSLSTFSF